jgi:hypothetical protein
MDLAGRIAAVAADVVSKRDDTNQLRAMSWRVCLALPTHISLEARATACGDPPHNLGSAPRTEHPRSSRDRQQVSATRRG